MVSWRCRPNLTRFNRLHHLRAAVRLTELLTPDRIRVPLQARDKKGVLRELVALLLPGDGSPGGGVLAAILARGGGTARPDASDAGSGDRRRDESRSRALRNDRRAAGPVVFPAGRPRGARRSERQGAQPNFPARAARAAAHAAPGGADTAGVLPDDHGGGGRVTEGSSTSWRTHRCGSLRPEQVGQQVRLGGWVHRRRDLGGIVFLDLRDRDGIVQVAFGPGWAQPDAIARAQAVGAESVVVVSGAVVARPAEMKNPELATGDVEVHATEIAVVGPAETPAIPVARGKGEELPAEELRLKHRHLDLRRPELQANLALRHR